MFGLSTLSTRIAVGGMVLGMVLLAAPARGGHVISTFTGGDTGEGLDLEGDFHVAVDTGNGVSSSYFLNNGPTNLEFRTEAAATAAGLYSTDGDRTYSAVLPNYGSNTNDTNLELIMQTGRYEAQPSSPPVDFDITLSDLTPGIPYKLQLLFHEPATSQTGVRQFNVLIPGDPIFDFDPVAYGSGNAGEYLKTGVVITHDFVASLSSFTVSFTEGSGNVPYVNGVTLETIPEPSTLALLALGGLFLVGYRWRRRSRADLS